MKIWNKEFVPFISKEEIAKRVKELGEQITDVYKGEELVIIGVLNGSFMFTSDLAKEIAMPAEVQFVRYASYEATESTGVVRELIGFTDNVKGKHVLIVEDIVDSGRTMKKLLEEVNQFEPASVKVVSLLFKPEALKVDVQVDYVGFEIDPRFVVGYGLDYDGLGRNIEEILVLKS
ncbi:hypoxanthine phosphoribosyltransferase [Limibacter armeniacum]|uniref:hypoxanthine phosphoribosyltransferase n=1 Tax=Limibacter armeniacum TaxID=466084 RepID=UPI002FE52836